MKLTLEIETTDRGQVQQAIALLTGCLALTLAQRCIIVVRQDLPYFQRAKIQAIKLLREASGLGLKESKDIIDHAEQPGGWINDVPPGGMGKCAALPDVIARMYQYGYEVKGL